MFTRRNTTAQFHYSAHTYFEPTTPDSEQLQTHALNRTATDTGKQLVLFGDSETADSSSLSLKD
jgi:hypothetical protein